MQLLNPESVGPFEFQAGPVGCLLIHGFTGSPYEMKGLGEHLAGLGISSSGPLLPGHGTHPRDLNDVSWRAWFETVLDAHDGLARRCDAIFACGLSMGGILALHLAAHRPLRGVTALASFLRPADWRMHFIDLLKYVHRYDPKGDLDIEDPDGRRSFAGYDVHPVWGASEMLRLCRHLREDLPDVDCPVLLMHGRLDRTVDFDQMEVVRRCLTRAPEVRTVPLDRSGHVVTLDVERERVCQELSRFIRTHAQAPAAVEDLKVPSLARSASGPQPPELTPPGI